MNLVLLEDADLVEPDLARLDGRRLRHVREVHRAAPGRELRVGLRGGPLGRGVVTRLDEVLELRVRLDEPPPAKLRLTLVLALPRPKVLARTVASATSLGVAKIVLVNAWRVEKAYWASPVLERLDDAVVAGLEQAIDTVAPEITQERLFVPFCEERLPELVAGATALVARPGEHPPARAGQARVVLAVGPERGFVEAELGSLARAGFAPVSLGPRVLRVETAVAALVGRMF